MSNPEICPARYALDSNGWVLESGLPNECMSCLYEAIEDGEALVTKRDTYLDAVQFMGGLSVFDPVNADSWRSTMMRTPEEGSTREVEIARGFDKDTQSYQAGTEVSVESVIFSCDI